MDIVTDHLLENIQKAYWGKTTGGSQSEVWDQKELYKIQPMFISKDIFKSGHNFYSHSSGCVKNIIRTFLGHMQVYHFPAEADQISLETD